MVAPVSSAPTPIHAGVIQIINDLIAQAMMEFAPVMGTVVAGLDAGQSGAVRVQLDTESTYREVGFPRLPNVRLNDGDRVLCMKDANRRWLVIGRVALGNGQAATQCIGVEHLYDDSVNGAKIVSGAIKSVHIDDNAVTSGKIDGLAVTTDKIQGLAVTGPKIADNAIASGKIQDNAVTTSKIQNNAVETLKIADGAVTQSKLEQVDKNRPSTTGAVITGVIRDGAITNAKLDKYDPTKPNNSGAVTGDVIRNGTITADKLGFTIASNAKNVTYGSYNPPNVDAALTAVILLAKCLYNTRGKAATTIENKCSKFNIT